MWFALIFIAGVIIGLIVGTYIYKSKKPKTIGVIRLDHSDPDDAPYLFLELARGVEDVYNAKYVTLEVKIENYISHK